MDASAGEILFVGAEGKMEMEKVPAAGYKIVGLPIVVPKDQARIRVQISAAHEKSQLDKCIAAFIKVGKELGVLK